MRTLLRSDTNRRKEKLVAGLSEMAAKAEDLLREAGSELEGKLGDAKATFSEAGTAVSEKARHAASATDSYVRQNPWRALGVAAAVGALLAILFTTRR